MWPFKSKKQKEQENAVWDRLSATYDGDPEFHPSLDLDAVYALSLSQKDRDKYLLDLMRRRQEAHEKDL